MDEWGVLLKYEVSFRVFLFWIALFTWKINEILLLWKMIVDKKLLKNYYDIPIVLKDKTWLTDKHAHAGKFYHLDGIEHALRIL